jgi:hypothetical protein
MDRHNGGQHYRDLTKADNPWPLLHWPGIGAMVESAVFCRLEQHGERYGLSLGQEQRIAGLSPWTGATSSGSGKCHPSEAEGQRG